MTGVFSGVRVIELAQYVYVPGAGVMLADLGAEVIKVETPQGDPYRHLKLPGTNRTMGTVNLSMEQNNRNKKSIALDLKTEAGREALLRLVETADVFLTSLRPKALRSLRLDPEDLRARNPNIIYVRGNGLGFRGDDADRPGFDASAFWARGGAAHAFTRPGQQPTSPRPAFGDHIGSLAIAFGIAAALFRRAATGEPSLVENSLLATAAWALSGDVTLVQMPGYATHPPQRVKVPLKSVYTTRDGKMVQFMILAPEPAWPLFCKALGLEALVHDPRFATEDARVANADALMPLIQERFASRDYAEWLPVLKAVDIPWEPIATIEDVAADPQLIANHAFATVDVDGLPVQVVAGPTSFDGRPMSGPVRPSPALGADTDELLAGVGYAADQIATLREAGIAR